ncbi:RNA polymerase sigma factor [Anatilimnocola aggregata]|uniref:RNA polymerase sigma factor n=1 Tax=Anatilimnocola aggregata TaxID=2528021 RepID=A0A517YHI2_9BACT|nr:sigma-70 family RNA polymerase sigma factor [Anatilimnocola aggregata]QDU29697.1 RNA polymerase sigma factor [Anatilimnocola aggregata]
MSAHDESSFGDDAELLRLLNLANQGDTTSMEQLFERLYPYLLLCAREELDSDLRAKVRESDLVQQSCLEAHRDFRELSCHNVHDLLHWLETILRSNAADLRRRFEATRRHGLEPQFSLDDSGSEQAQDAKQNLLDQHPLGSGSSSAKDLELDAAISRLPAEYRDVILMRHRDKLSFAQIGQRTERTADAARMLWARAVKRLEADMNGPESQ